MSPSSIALPHKNPRPSTGILTGFPFDRRPKELGNFEKTELPYLLGSTNPGPTDVLQEPFSTSVFKVLILIFATTTKICTRGCFTPVHTKSFLTVYKNLHACLLVIASLLQ